MKQNGFVFFILTLMLLKANAQEPLKIILTGKDSVVHEGSVVNFDVKAIGGKGQNYKYSIARGKSNDMRIDSLGHFQWTPAFNLVGRITGSKKYEVVFEVNDDSSHILQKKDFWVLHTNRPPTVNDLIPFYIKYNTTNTYHISNDFIKDEDNDPIVFIPIYEQLPEGMKLSSEGIITWLPSYEQFKSLKQKPLYVEFYVEDEPAKSHTKARLKIEATQLDLPPEITVVPNQNLIKAKENTSINFRFYLSDPNGSDDIQTFGFVSEYPNIPKNSLIKNSNNQYDFIWKPAYDFVKDPYDSVAFHIDFFVLDMSQKRAEQRINFVIKNAENEIEKSKRNYFLYRNALLQGWELMQQLNDKENELKKLYKEAKKGKKNRSMLTASLGAMTGLSPVLSANVAARTTIATVGGTSTLTLGTLEATEVLGQPMKDLLDRLSYVIEKKNELQTKGDIYARDYSSKKSRSANDFLKKTDELMAVMSLKGLVVLELDASWKPKNKPTDVNIRKIFSDFSIEVDNQ